MDKPPERSADDIREEELLKRAAALEKTIQEATEAAKKLSAENTPTTDTATTEIDSSTTTPDTITPTPDSTKNIITPETVVGAEVRTLSKEERGQLSIGLHNIGFIIEKKKSDYFAKTFDWISKKGDQKGTTARFTRGLRDSYRKDAEMAQKKAGAGKEAGTITKVSNVAYLAKNILRPMRLIMDATGMSPAGVQRIVMLGGMVLGRTTGAIKEARLANEDVAQKTRIGEKNMVMAGRNNDELDIHIGWQTGLTPEEQEDIAKAQEEAMRVYENAQKKAGTNGNVTADELKTAYLHEIPKDLQERLKNTTVANGMVQGVLRKHLEFDIGRLNENIKTIEEDAQLTPAKKESRKEQLLRRWEKRLTDYDRVLTQAGTVDEYAMAARYAETTSKNVVRAMTVQTLYLSLEKLFGGISHILSNTEIQNIQEVVSQGRRDAGSPVETGITQPEELGNIPAPRPPGIIAEVEIPPETTPSTPEPEPQMTGQTTFREIIPEDTGTVTTPIMEPTDLGPIDPNTLEPTGPSVAEIEVNPDAIVRKGEGIEHAFRRQIEENEGIARERGYKGEMNDTEALHKFSGSAAHRLALEKGYVDRETGEEIWVKPPDKIAYQIKLDGEELKVDEFEVEEGSGKFVETHEGKEEFEGKGEIENYEYKHERYQATKPQAPAPERLISPDTTEEQYEYGLEPVEYPKSVPEREVFGSPDTTEEQYIKEGNQSAEQIADNIKQQMDSVAHKNVEQSFFATSQPGHVRITEQPMDVSHSIFTQHPEFVGNNDFHLAEGELREAYDVHQSYIEEIFPSQRSWEVMSRKNAKDIFENGEYNNNDTGSRGPTYHYLSQLKKLTGLKPRGNWLFGREKVGEYVARALQKLAEDGNLGELKK